MDPTKRNLRMRSPPVTSYTVPPETRGSLSTTIGKATLIGFLLALWLATHPYMGIVHDARLYLIQTLHLMDPVQWRDDLFFKYGTQDSFSLFSNGYKFFVSSLGANRADQIALLLGSALWMAGIGGLTGAILKQPTERIAAVCGVIALSSGYGRLDFFHYAEPFVTPRLFAEAAIMGGLALAIQCRYVWMSLLTVLALALHPLATLPGIGIMAVSALRQHPRAWIAMGLSLITGLIFAELGIEPFARVLEFYDTAWFQIIKVRNNAAIISTWSATDYAGTVATFLTLGTFLTVASTQERRLTLSVLTATTAACALSFLGTDLGHNVLITNLQLWRTLWITTLASNATLFLLILRTSGVDRVVLTIAAIFKFLPQFLLGLSLAAPFCIILCLSWFLRKRLPNQQARFATGCVILALTPAVIALTIKASYVQILFDQHISQHTSSLTLAMVAILGLAWTKRHPPSKRFLAIAVASLVSCLVLMDQRTAWNRYVYGSQPDKRLSQFLSDSGQTYWEGMGLEALWFKARKPSYYSCAQGSESIFFRAEALEWSRRKSELQPMNTEDFSSPICGPKSDPSAVGPDSMLQVEDVCKRLPDLDTIILNHPVPGLPRQSWTAPASQEITVRAADSHLKSSHIANISTFYRYNCADLRGQHDDHPSK